MKVGVLFSEECPLPFAPSSRSLNMIKSGLRELHCQAVVRQELPGYLHSINRLKPEKPRVSPRDSMLALRREEVVARFPTLLSKDKYIEAMLEYEKEEEWAASLVEPHKLTTGPGFLGYYHNGKMIHVALLSIELARERLS